MHTLISEYQIDTMYRVGLHNLSQTHELDTLYRVGIKRY